GGATADGSAITAASSLPVGSVQWYPVGGAQAPIQGSLRI
ncbi:hypothetical protein TSMEX_005710, partial [Taenia solium]